MVGFLLSYGRVLWTAPMKSLVIQGDWKAKVGPDADEQWTRTVGRFGAGETNERGERLLEFAHKHKMTLVNTLLPHKISRRTTWHSPDGIIHSHIDFILIILAARRLKSTINGAKSRTFPGTDIISDQELIIMTVKLKLKKNLQNHGQDSSSTVKS